MVTNKIINLYFSHMTYLMSHVTSLNNTCEWFYKLSRSGFEQTSYKLVCSQTLSIVKKVSISSLYESDDILIIISRRF